MALGPKSIVPIIGEPDIDESYIRQQDSVLLKTLLIDHTMTALNDGIPVNIKWAIDDYAVEYPEKVGYGCEDSIALDAISSSNGKDLKVVTPRVKKRREEQERRPRSSLRRGFLTNRTISSTRPGLDARATSSTSPILISRRDSTSALIFLHYCDVFKGRNFPPAVARRFAEIISWNIWQMDGIKFVVPNTCHDVKSETPNLDGSVEVRTRPCDGCCKGDVMKHNGIRCRVMDWETGKPVLFMPPFEFKPIETNTGNCGG